MAPDATHPWSFKTPGVKLFIWSSLGSIECFGRDKPRPTYFQDTAISLANNLIDSVTPSFGGKVIESRLGDTGDCNERYRRKNDNTKTLSQELIMPNWEMRDLR
jgi:hypothetical protein